LKRPDKSTKEIDAMRTRSSQEINEAKIMAQTRRAKMPHYSHIPATIRNGSASFL
jgi:hypothetical protein